MPKTAEVVVAVAPAEEKPAAVEAPPLAPPPAPPALTVGAVVRGTSAAGEPGAAIGVRGAYGLNHRLSVGAAGFVTVWDPRASALSYRNARYLRFYYLGLELGYAVTLPDPLGLRLRGLVGAGGVTHHSYHANDVSAPTQAFVVAEPGLELYWPILDKLTVAAGVGYRWAWGADFAPSLRAVRTANGETTIDGALQGVTLDLSGTFELW
ncbi:MAG: hypothetical protein HY903_20945 [Deltaproteobacteria bacterium]|nr:hypothetical protein [Deltaproteobacteria bacterium]